MNTTINAIVNGQRVNVAVSAAEVLYLANQIENALQEATQNIIVFAADAYNWCDGHNIPAVGIRKANSVGGVGCEAIIGDVSYLISGDLRRMDNDQEITRLRDLMAIGYENAYIDLRGQSVCYGRFSRVDLGKRKIVNMQMVRELAYLTLAPIE